MAARQVPKTGCSTNASPAATLSCHQWQSWWCRLHSRRPDVQWCLRDKTLHGSCWQPASVCDLETGTAGQAAPAQAHATSADAHLQHTVLPLAGPPGLELSSSLSTAARMQAQGAPPGGLSPLVALQCSSD